MTRRIRRPLGATVSVPLARILAARTGSGSGSTPVCKGPSIPSSPANLSGSDTSLSGTQTEKIG